MKRVFALLLAAVMLLSLAACGGGNENAAPSGGASSGGTSSASASSGGTQAEIIENKIDFSIDKNHYEQAERIEVTMDFADVNKDSAIIVIVSSELSHGQSAPAYEDAKEYRWIADFSEIPFYLWAPEEDGIFDVRVYAGENDKELASAAFAVGNATLPPSGDNTGSTAPTSEGNNDGGGLSWPVDIAYVPNIPYAGSGRIVYMEENEFADEYSIYINDASLESANEYIQKLYDNGYTLMWMFRDEDETYNPTSTFLEKPKTDNHFKLGFDSPDEKIGVVTIIHDGHPKKNDTEYNFVITFADMDF